MKKGGLLLSGVLVTSLLAAVFLVPKSAQAAACTNVSTYGSVRLSIPTLPNDGEVGIWVRMQAENPTPKLLLELNDVECLEVRGDNVKKDSWSWQAYKNKNDRKVIKFNSVSGNNVKVIGIDDGVRIDKILFTSKDCIPQDFGDNCVDAAGLNASQYSNTSVTQLDPPSTESVSGNIEITPTPESFLADLEKVQYIVDGKVVQESVEPIPFDTTRVVDGKHTVLVETTLSSGQVIRESTVINVKNPLNPFSPIIRWVKLNPNTFKVIIYTLIAAFLFMIMIRLFRKFVINRRHRRFHGF